MNTDTKIRTDIINAAYKLFSNYGYCKTSIDNIAKLSHHAKGSIYYNFTNKNEIFKIIISLELKKIMKQLTEIREQSEPDVDQMIAYLLRRMQLLSEALVYKQTLSNENMNNDQESLETSAALRKQFDEWERQYFMELCNKGIQAGALKPDLNADSFADMLQMVLKSLEIQFFTKSEYEKSKPTFDYLVRLLLGNIKIQ